MARNKRLKLREHQLYTVLPTVWKRLKLENHIDRIYWFRARRIERMSSLFTFGYWLQDTIYSDKIQNTNLEQPIFILGLWRSGTTHLHYAMARDPQFGYLSNHQAFTFNMALLSGDRLNPLFDLFVPKKRPQDNVRLTLNDPAEEEQPFSTMTTRSAIHSFYFPGNQCYFRKYHLFEDISAGEKSAWQQDYLFLLKNIALYSGKSRLLLKNPHNTGRVRELLELFPDAKFIFIHRDPATVYRSAKKLTIEKLIIENNREIIDKYLKERIMIPDGNLVEIAYRDLETAPWDTIQKIYTCLGLSGLDQAEPSIREYLDSVSNYRKNRYSPLPSKTRIKLEKDWNKLYTTWGYPLS